MKDWVLCVENFKILHYCNNVLSLSYQEKGAGEVKKKFILQMDKNLEMCFLITIFNLLIYVFHFFLGVDMLMCVNRGIATDRIIIKKKIYKIYVILSKNFQDQDWNMTMINYEVCECNFRDLQQGFPNFLILGKH